MADYQGVLVDLRSKLASLDKQREALKTAISAIEGLLPRTHSLFTDPAVVDTQKFEGVTLRQAVEQHLRDFPERQTTAQIADALKAGGIKGGAKSFMTQVYNALYSMSKDGRVAKGADGRWSLPEVEGN